MLKSKIKSTIYTKRRITMIAIAFCMLIFAVIRYIHFEKVKNNTELIELEVIDKYCGRNSSIAVIFENEKREISVSTNRCASIAINSSQQFYYSKEFDYLRLKVARNRQNTAFIILALGLFITTILPITIKDW